MEPSCTRWRPAYFLVMLALTQAILMQTAVAELFGTCAGYKTSEPSNVIPNETEVS